MTQEVLKLALAAFYQIFESTPPYRDDGTCVINDKSVELSNKAIAAIKEALAQHDSVQAKPEPEQESVADDFFKMIADRNPKPFSSLQRTWVGLFDDEIDAIYTGVRAVHREIDSDVFARAIEAKLKDKNCVG